SRGGRADVASPRPARHLPTTMSGERRPSSAGTISKTASIDRQGEGSCVIANGTTSGGRGRGEAPRPLRGPWAIHGRPAGALLHGIKPCPRASPYRGRLSVAAPGRSGPAVRVIAYPMRGWRFGADLVWSPQPWFAAANRLSLRRKRE